MDLGWGLRWLDCKPPSTTHLTHSRCLRNVTCLVSPSPLFGNSGVNAEPRPSKFAMEVLTLCLPRGAPISASLTHLQAQKQPEPCKTQPSMKREFTRVPLKSQIPRLLFHSLQCVCPSQPMGFCVNSQWQAIPSSPHKLHTVSKQFTGFGSSTIVVPGKSRLMVEL